MHPRPIAETVSPDFPSVRRSMGGGDAARGRFVSRSRAADNESTTITRGQNRAAVWVGELRRVD